MMALQQSLQRILQQLLHINDIHPRTLPHHLNLHLPPTKGPSNLKHPGIWLKVRPKERTASLQPHVQENHQRLLRTADKHPETSPLPLSIHTPPLKDPSSLNHQNTSPIPILEVSKKANNKNHPAIQQH